MLVARIFKEVIMNNNNIQALNKLVNKYFVKGFDIYFMHGVIASAMCSGKNTDIPKIFFGRNAIVPMKTKLTTEPDTSNFFRLFQELYDYIEVCFETGEPFVPLVNITELYTSLANIEDLSEDEQKNLLSWYIGYFFAYKYTWDISNIISYVHNELDCINSVLEGVQIQLITVKKLLMKFKPKTKDIRVGIAIDTINGLCDNFTKSETEFIQKSFPDVDVISFKLAELFRLNSLVKNGKITSDKKSATKH